MDYTEMCFNSFIYIFMLLTLKATQQSKAICLFFKCALEKDKDKHIKLVRFCECISPDCTSFIKSHESV